VIALQIESSTITRRRLAARIKDSIPYGSARSLCASIEISEVYLSRALSRPDSHRSEFARVAVHFGWVANPNVDGQFSCQQRDPIRGDQQHEVELIVAAISLDPNLKKESAQ
jgi:hypothetical protein